MALTGAGRGTTLMSFADLTATVFGARVATYLVVCPLHIGNDQLRVGTDATLVMFFATMVKVAEGATLASPRNLRPCERLK